MAIKGNGPLRKVRRWYPGGGTVQRDQQNVLPSAVDLWCVNASGGNLTGAIAGCDVVTINTSTVNPGEPPKIVKADSDLSMGFAVVGVICEDQGTVANGKGCWVRVFGYHDYANVHGGSAIAAENGLMAGDGGSSKSGMFVKGTTTALLAAQAREAYSTGSVAAKKVFLFDRFGFSGG